MSKLENLHNFLKSKLVEALISKHGFEDGLRKATALYRDGNDVAKATLADDGSWYIPSRSGCSSVHITV